MHQKFKIGQKVKTEHYGYVGDITRVVRMEPKDSNWIKAQAVLPTLGQLLGHWYHVKLDTEGAVLVAENELSLVPQFKCTCGCGEMLEDPEAACNELKNARLEY